MSEYPIFRDIDSTDIFDFVFARATHQLSAMPGEKRLMLAVLEEAYHSVVRGNAMQREDAWMWFETGDGDEESLHPFSYLSILSVFNIESLASKLRNHVRRQYQQASRQNAAPSNFISRVRQCHTTRALGGKSKGY